MRNLRIGLVGLVVGLVLLAGCGREVTAPAPCLSLRADTVWTNVGTIAAIVVACPK